ncbi:serine protease [Marinagarivorans cellulosilyticus]|uniref:Serine protease n=1 Tax=Marinagarivorans cellulosilyticus TaxID=2721545 RepID=A0AAN2BIX9_9GAMM|nr:serine protease [Marinagarivorans cellulosilyticus]BCD96392.1 hypothetical protein MARGE09_P0592 [Marinagarivorans cellulosilyticus]
MESAQLPQIIVKIRVPKSNGYFAVGTGFVIAADLVATAKHVVEFSKRNVDRPVELHRAQDLSLEDPPKYLADRQYAYIGGNAVDFVVLRLTQSIVSDLNFPLIAREFPEAHDKWLSYGFPVVGKRLEDFFGELVPVMGTFFPTGADNNSCHLKSADNAKLAPRDDAGQSSAWQGLSGAPVFRNGKFYGCISSSPTSLEERFRAISFPSLLRNCSEFREFVNTDLYPESKVIQEFQQSLIAKITPLLKDLPIFNELLEEYGYSRETSPGELATIFVTEPGYQENCKDILDAIKDILSREDIVARYQGEWAYVVQSAVILCKWLILNVVRTQWLRAKNLDKDCFIDRANLNSIELSSAVEVELIVARCLMVAPKIQQNSANNQLQCGSELSFFDAFEAHNPEATHQELLIPLYKEFFRRNPEGLSESRIVEAIIEHVASETSQGRPRRRKTNRASVIYFLINKDRYDRLQNNCQELLTKFGAALGGRLQFICCGGDDGEAFSEPLTNLLAALRSIYVLNTPR